MLPRVSDPDNLPAASGPPDMLGPDGSEIHGELTPESDVSRNI